MDFTREQQFTTDQESGFLDCETDYGRPQDNEMISEGCLLRSSIIKNTRFSLTEISQISFHSYNLSRASLISASASLPFSSFLMLWQFLLKRR
jgi:hypothetical protein